MAGFGGRARLDRLEVGNLAQRTHRGVVLFEVRSIVLICFSCVLAVLLGPWALGDRPIAVFAERREEVSRLAGAADGRVRFADAPAERTGRAAVGYEPGRRGRRRVA